MTPTSASPNAPALDTLGMFEVLLKTDTQLEAGAESARGLGEALKNTSIKNIVLAGMGGSGITGDLIAALLVPKSTCPVPFLTVKSYELPDFVNDETLVIAVSFSGNTAETLQCVKSALEKSAQIVAVTTGGELAKLAEQNSFPVALQDSTIPMPRAGLAAMSSAVLRILSEAGFYPNFADELAQAKERIGEQISRLSGEESPAHKMAIQITGTFPIIVGGAGIGAVAAKRWKTQINENTKTPAFYSELPESAHNEIVGWGLHGDITRQVFSLVQLRSNYEDEPLDDLFKGILELQREVVSQCYEVRAVGEGMLAQAFELILFGDFISLYMADRVEVDPGPIPAIIELKEMCS